MDKLAIAEERISSFGSGRKSRKKVLIAKRRWGRDL